MTITSLSDEKCDELLTGEGIFGPDAARPCDLPGQMFPSQLEAARKLLRFAFALGTASGPIDYLPEDLVASLIRGNGLMDIGIVRPFRHTEDMGKDQLANTLVMFGAAFKIGQESSTNA